MPCTLSTTPLYLGVATGIYLLSNLFFKQYSSKIFILGVLLQRYVYSLPLSVCIACILKGEVFKTYFKKDKALEGVLSS